MIKYRIKWHALKTGAHGHGQPVFKTREMAMRTAHELNEENKGILEHTVESVETHEINREDGTA